MNVRSALKQQWPLEAYRTLRKRVLGKGVAPATFDRTLSGTTFNFECWTILCTELEISLTSPDQFPNPIPVPSWYGSQPEKAMEGGKV